MWGFQDDKLKNKVRMNIDNNKSKYDGMKNVDNKINKNIIHENMLTMQFVISIPHKLIPIIQKYNALCILDLDFELLLKS